MSGLRKPKDDLPCERRKSFKSEITAAKVCPPISKIAGDAETQADDEVSQEQKRTYRGAGTSASDGRDASPDDDLEALPLRSNVGVCTTGAAVGRRRQ